MGSFEFEWQGRKYRLRLERDDNVRREYLHPENGQWVHIERYVDPHDTLLKTLLARNEALAALFREQQDIARRMNERLANAGDSYTPKLDAIEARAKELLPARQQQPLSQPRKGE